MVAMSGAIMPEPLAMPGDRAPGRRRSRPSRVAPLGKVSVVMIASAAARPSRRPTASASTSPARASILAGVEQHADHAGGGAPSRCAGRQPAHGRRPRRPLRRVGARPCR